MIWSSKPLRAVLHVTAIVLFTLTTVSVGSVVIATPAEAKQCIWNKAGFVLRARWYKASDVLTLRNSAGETGYGLRVGAKHVQLDEWPVAQGRCTRGANANQNLVAVLSIVGGGVVHGIANINQKFASATAGTVTCAATFGGSCSTTTATAGSAAAIVGNQAAVAMAGGDRSPVQNFPNANEVFKVVQPSTSRWLDVWGTAFSPQTGPGGSL